MPSAVVLLAEGAEEMEAVITVDVLRRGGVDTKIAGLIGTSAVTCSRSCVIVPDVAVDEIRENKYDAVVCPGGMEGAKSLAASTVVGKMLNKQMAQGGIVACICAAPLALASHKVGLDRRVTSHPVVQKNMLENGYEYCEDRVVVDGNLVTSRGPGTAFEFALKLVELLAGKEVKDSIMPGMLLPEAVY